MMVLILDLPHEIRTAIWKLLITPELTCGSRKSSPGPLDASHDPQLIRLQRTVRASWSGIARCNKQTSAEMKELIPKTIGTIRKVIVFGFAHSQMRFTLADAQAQPSIGISFALAGNYPSRFSKIGSNEKFNVLRLGVFEVSDRGVLSLDEDIFWQCSVYEALVLLDPGYLNRWTKIRGRGTNILQCGQSVCMRHHGHLFEALKLPERVFPSRPILCPSCWVGLLDASEL